MLHNYSENKCIDTQVLKNLVTTGFKGLACMLQVRHKLKLPVGDLKQAVDDALSLHCLLQSSHGPLNYYFQWPPVAFHHKFSTTLANCPLGKACCLLMEVFLQYCRLLFWSVTVFSLHNMQYLV